MGKKFGEDELTVEEVFEAKEVPTWRSQVKFRSIFVSAVLGFAFTFIVMKLSLTNGIIPTLNVVDGLLGFFLIKVWISVASKFGFSIQPFTRQENTMIQTCVVSASGIAFSGGFSSYVLGMTKPITDLGPAIANTASNVHALHLLWMYGFLAAVSFVGIFSILHLRKIMIVDYKLTYPSGTATAYLINNFHTPSNATRVHTFNFSDSVLNWANLFA